MSNNPAKDRWLVVCTNLDRCPSTKQMTDFQNQQTRHGDSKSDLGFVLQFGKGDKIIDILVDRANWKRGMGFTISGIVTAVQGTGPIGQTLRKRVRVTQYDPVMRTAARLEKTNERK